jgi:glutathione S-transferase
MYTLYTHPISQHARRVVALLELAGIPYEPRIVNLAKGEHMAPDYLKVNPNHQVPTLVDGDIVIHESGAILRWLCHRHDLGDWYPADFRQRAAIEQWLDWTQCKFGVAVSAIVFNTLFAGERADKEALRRGEQSLTELLPILEAALTGRDWLAGGAHPSIADIAAGTNIAHLGLAGAAPDSPAITAWHERLCALPGFAKALPPQMATA